MGRKRCQVLGVKTSLMYLNNFLADFLLDIVGTDSGSRYDNNPGYSKTDLNALCRSIKIECIVLLSPHFNY